MRRKYFLLGKFFEDFLNQARTTLTDTCNTIDFGKKEVFTLTEMAAAIQKMKSGKAASEYEIRSEMLKVLNGEDVVSSKLVDKGVQVGAESWKTPQDWQSDVIIFLNKKGGCKESANY